MSASLIARSPDLQRLRDEGYDVSIVAGHLVLRGVPYVTSAGAVALGQLVSDLSIAGDQTVAPENHVALFAGEPPCDQHGVPIEGLVNGFTSQQLGDGLEISCSFSRKPLGGYPDYYVKMTTYANLLQGPAQVLDPSATAASFPPVATEEGDASPFRYMDSATSRARIGAVVEKLAGERIAIVGLGGTGSYVLDLVAKTPVGQIELYDGDVLLTHNAFRAPGAVPIDRLRERPTKAEYWAAVYGAMHGRLVAHPHAVDGSTVELLRQATFVFIAMDSGPAKRLILEHLEAWGIPFVDSGMAVYQHDTSLGGIVRTSSWTPAAPSLLSDGRLSFAEPDDGEYEQNIQIAELNAMAACLAVIRWKKSLGVYLDDENERSSFYTIEGDQLLNEGGAT